MAAIVVFISPPNQQLRSAGDLDPSRPELIKVLSPSARQISPSQDMLIGVPGPTCADLKWGCCVA